MRIAVVGALAALAMTLTSSVVWSMTAPRDSSEPWAQPGTDTANPPKRNGPKVEPDDRPELPKAIVDKSTFVTGKTLMLEGRLGHARMLANATSETYLFVDVRSEVDSSGFGGGTAFEPLNLAIVIDRSGSMVGQRERNAIDAAAGMIRRLRDGDTVSVVSYSNDARIILPVTTVSAATHDQLIRTMIDNMTDRPDGSTCISCGLDLGMRTLVGRRAGIDRMLLLSDGEANRGVTDETGIRSLARQARNQGATISSIGVDIDYNEILMSALAREANGHHYFSETGSNLEQIFDQELESLVKTVAKDGKLEVELAPGVRVAEVFGRAYQQVDRKVIVPLGTFTPGEDKTLLLRLEVPASPAGERPIANVTLAYQDLATREPGECFGELAAHMTSNATEVAQLDAIVLGRLSRGETARTLEQANLLFAEGRAAEAQAIVNATLEKNAQQRQKAGTLSGAAGFFDPFNRNLDDDFAEQEEALDEAAAGFSAAQAAPKPTASRPGKSQVRKNAEAATSFDL